MMTQLAALCSGLFAGASVYINLVEQRLSRFGSSSLVKVRTSRATR